MPGVNSRTLALLNCMDDSRAQLTFVPWFQSTLKEVCCVTAQDISKSFQEI